MNQRVGLTLLAGLLSGAACASSAINAGAPLDQALGLTSDDDRYGLDGSPPGPRGQVPTAPEQPGAHWLVTYDNAGRARRWLPFVVAGEATYARALSLLVDDQPPTGTIQLSGAVDEHTDGVVMAPQASTQLIGADPSGGVVLRLMVDGNVIASPERWTDGRPDGTYSLALLTRDALGNEGLRSKTTVTLDATPPELSWTRRDGVVGVPEDVYDGKRATLGLRLRDAGAGIRTARVSAQTLMAEQLRAEEFEFEVDGQALDYELTDGVGNMRRGTIPLRADREGPRLVARRDGALVDIESSALGVSDRITLEAQDLLSGVERACVEASIWYGECRELPVDLIGITPGKYSLRLRAVDRLGNQRSRRVTLEVTP